MPFEITWTDSAIRQSSQLERAVARRIFEKVGHLSDDPSLWVRRLSAVSAYRLRVGKYRVLVDINEGQLRALVVRAGHRESAYD